MKAFVDYTGKKATVTVVGRIDTVTSPDLRKALADIDYEAVDSLEMDFADLSYISSAGLRELLSLKKRLGKKPFFITNVSEDIESIFEVTGFATILDYSVTGKEEDFSLMSFKEFLSCKASKHPDKEILKAGGVTYTWEDIDKCSQIIAKDLASLGVKKGTHVGICGFDSANWILTFYAVQKLGAIACLINFNLGADEIIRTASAGDVTHLCCGEMTQRSDELFASLVAENSPVTMLYDISSEHNYKDRLGEYDGIKDRFEGKVEADDACVMVYTSGSTGVPKGVLLSAYNVLNAACSNARSLLLTKNDRACLMLPLFHIFGLVAGCLANAVADAETIIPDSVRTDALLKTIHEEKCTVFHSVPTMLIAIVNNRSFSSEKVATLRSTILSGALASPSQVEMLMKTFPNDHFAAAYGLSEMAPVSITDYDDSKERIMHTIGKPIEGIDIRIYDNDAHHECPAGQPGEIQVQGFNLMSCYYKAELNLQAIDEDGWLHTGDIGYMDEDGYLHFAGRIKEIIIRAGENIFPAEVAEAIISEECIANAAVCGVPDDFWGENVAAAVVMKDGCAFDEAALREALSSKLAKFKMPRYFFVYDSFPVLPNGKIDMVTLKKDLEEKTKRVNEEG